MDNKKLKVRRDWTELSALAKDAYCNGERGALSRLAEQRNVPLSTLSAHIRCVLRLPSRRNSSWKRIQWTDEEDQIIRKFGAERAAALQKRLEKIGKIRGLSAIKHRRAALRRCGVEIKPHDSCYSVAEIAAALGVSVSTVGRWIKTGLLVHRNPIVASAPVKYEVTFGKLRAFLIHHCHTWSYQAKPDLVWLVDFLTNHEADTAC